MRKVLLVLLAVVLSIGIALTGCAGDTGAKPLIKIGDLNWGSAHFQAETAKIIIEEGYDYPVELVPGKTITVWQGLLMGEVDVDIEVWLPNQQEAWDKGIADGDAIDLGISNNDNWQSLFCVPTYVIKGDSARGIEPMAPDLKSVFDLDQPQYKEMFKNPENPSKGMILNCIPGWACEQVNIEQLAAYGLDDDYDLTSPGSQAGLEASMTGAYNKGEPWLGYYWGPTWISGLLDLTLLEEPAYDEQVFLENHGCAYPSADLHVAVYKDFPDKAPELVEMLENWKMNTQTLSEALAYMNETEGEPIDAAIWFLKERESVWTKFVPADVAQKVKDAVAGM
jgi:glycine betaine/proline transport system substrate-binding protein